MKRTCKKDLNICFVLLARAAAQKRRKGESVSSYRLLPARCYLRYIRADLRSATPLVWSGCFPQQRSRCDIVHTFRLAGHRSEQFYLDAQILWRAQRFVNLEVQISWLV